MRKATIAIIIIILFHIVGLAGFLIPAWRPLFLQIVPFHILLMLAVISYAHEPFGTKLLQFMIVTFVLGFTVEWLGVHTHVIFGNYFYGKTLGVKLFDIPVIIAVNWFLLIYSVGVTMLNLFNNRILRIVAGAIVLVLLDVLIEPIAVKFDYWHWAQHIGPLTAPFGNYAGWFMVSAVMLMLFECFRFNRQNKVGMVLLITQFLFFALLNLA